MAFNPAAFISNLNSIESNNPQSRSDFANAWANAFFAGYGNPTPPSLTAAAGKSAMMALFMLAYKDNSNGKKFMNAGVSVFAATMAPGMLPAFASVPPMSYQGFAQVNIDTVEAKGQLGPALAAVTSPWFMSGTAVQTTSGTPTTWL